MNILITGATGFIGTHLAKALAYSGEGVRALCRPNADITSLSHPNIEIVWGDIMDPTSIKDAMTGCDRAFHLAAYARNWAKDFRTFVSLNVGGLRNVLEAADGTLIKKVVFTSTALTLGPSHGTPISESSPRVVSFFTEYERSKFLAEAVARHYALEGLDVVIVNPTRVFGPGLLTEANSVTRMIRWYLEGKWRVIPGDGSGVGNYAYVDDVVNGHILAMQAGRAGERYLLGGQNVSYNEFFDLLSEISKRKYRLFHVPASIMFGLARVEELRAEWYEHYPLITPGWVDIFCSDWACSKAKSEAELGYRVTPLREALARTTEWLLDRRSKESGIRK